MKKKVLSFVVALCMLSALVLIPLPSSAAISGDYTYTVNDDGTATITKYTGSAAEVTIPEKIDGYTVTVIGEDAFRYSTVSKVVLPDTIERIDKHAFMSSSLANIILPNSITYIATEAFVGSELVYINLPSSLTTINSATFAACGELAYVRIPHTVISISSNAFSA